MKIVHILVLSALCLSAGASQCADKQAFYKKPLPLLGIAAGIGAAGALAYKIYSYVGVRSDVQKTVDALIKLEQTARELYNANGNHAELKAVYKGLEDSLIALPSEEKVHLHSLVMGDVVQLTSFQDDVSLLITSVRDTYRQPESISERIKAGLKKDWAWIKSFFAKKVA